MELERACVGNRLAKIGIAGRGKETLPITKPDRVVIYGSRTSGAPVVADELQKYLQEKGLNNPSVEVVRNVAVIENAFYDVPIGQNVNSKNIPHNIPKGVIVFPQMRQYSEDMGMSVDTNAKNLSGMSRREYIQRLCDKNKVPYIIVENSTPNEEVLSKLLYGISTG